MTSRSARVSAERPFYDLHADACDAFVTDSPSPGWRRCARLAAAGDHRVRTETLGNGASLTYVSRPRWQDGRLLVAETYELTTPGGRVSAHAYDFEMRPWTAGELRARLTSAGFDVPEVRPGGGRSTPDRLFVVAARS